MLSLWFHLAKVITICATWWSSQQTLFLILSTVTDCPVRVHSHGTLSFGKIHQLLGSVGCVSLECCREGVTCDHCAVPVPSFLSCTSCTGTMVTNSKSWAFPGYWSKFGFRFNIFFNLPFCVVFVFSHFHHIPFSF